MKKLIVFGSLNMDLTISSDKIPQKGETIHGHDFLTNVGGKGCNQVVAAVKSGCRAEFIGGVGDDVFGDQIINTLKNYNINTSNIQRLSNESTGVAIIIRSENDNRIILNSGANYKLNIDKAVSSLETIGCRDDIFLAQFENQIDAVKLMLKKAKSLGMYTILNPAPAKYIEPETYKYIDLMIVNQTETQILTGIYPDSENSCMDAFRAFREKGAGRALITLGGKGSVTMLEGKLYKEAAYAVKIVDSTAAGDAYIGGLISELVKNTGFKNCMNYASKVAALTITKVGAQQSIPYMNEVEDYFKKEGI